MTDPTTAEAVIAEAIAITDRQLVVTPWCLRRAAAVVAALRSSPEALADLMGGRYEFAGVYDVPGRVTVAYEDEADDPERDGWRPLFVFVPQEGADRG